MYTILYLTCAAESGSERYNVRLRVSVHMCVLYNIDIERTRNFKRYNVATVGGAHVKTDRCASLQYSRAPCRSPRRCTRWQPQDAARQCADQRFVNNVCTTTSRWWIPVAFVIAKSIAHPPFVTTAVVVDGGVDDNIDHSAGGPGGVRSSRQSRVYICEFSAQTVLHIVYTRVILLGTEDFSIYMNVQLSDTFFWFFFLSFIGNP